jgi:hypothetical protein
MHAHRLTGGLVAILGTAVASGAAPVVVPWTAAPAHVGARVTVEGVVARAETTAAGRCVLVFDPADPAALRVVLLVPLVTDLPRDPSRLYDGKRVRATGRVARFQGRLEMVVTPPQLEVVGLAGLEPENAPRPRAMDSPPPVPSPAPVLPTAPSPDPRCRAWREERDTVRTELRALARDFDACLASGRSGCAPAGDRLGPPLSRLAALEAHLARTCP